MKERFDELVLNLNILRAFGGDPASLSDRANKLRERWHDLSEEVVILQGDIRLAIEQAWFEKKSKAIMPKPKGGRDVST